MNYWIQLSIEYANQRSYLDDLFRVYPTIPEGIRDIDSGLWKEIEKAFENHNNTALLENLLQLDLFPIKDSYVAYLKRDRESLKRNPATVARLGGRLYEMGLDEIYSRSSEPKETNRQIGPLFKRWLKKKSLGIEPMKLEDFLNTKENAIFGSKRCRNDITRIKCNPKNFNRKAYGNVKDLILFYSKSESPTWNDPITPFTEEDIARLFKKIDKDGRKYTTIPLHAPGETVSGRTGQEWQGMKPPKGRHWRSEPEVLEQLDEQGLIEWSATGVPRKKIFADEKEGKKMQDIWEFKDSQYPSYPTEKNLNLLKFIIKASSNEGDLVLDCFCGSGTTLIAAQELNRKWIGIDKSEQAIKVAKKRLSEIPSSLFSRLDYEMLVQK